MPLSSSLPPSLPTPVRRAAFPAPPPSSPQAQQEILANPMSANSDDHGGAAAAAAAEPPAEASNSTPVRPRVPPSVLSHLTPVGNWNSTNDRSRLSGAGWSPTECLRDYLSGLQGKEEEEEENEVSPHGLGSRCCLLLPPLLLALFQPWTRTRCLRCSDVLWDPSLFSHFS